MAVVNKIFFNFKDSNDKDVTITINKVGAYSAENEQRADDIASTILANKVCLNLDLQYLKKVVWESVDTVQIIKDGEQQS